MTNWSRAQPGIDSPCCDGMRRVSGCQATALALNARMTEANDNDENSVPRSQILMTLPELNVEPLYGVNQRRWHHACPVYGYQQIPS